MDPQDPDFTLPAEWSDEERMHYLLAPFPPDRTPSRSDQKCMFWRNLILSSSQEIKKPCFTEAELTERLRWQGLPAKCLPVVIQNMEKSGELQKQSEFEAAAVKRGWVSWGVNVVARPVSWAWRSYFSPQTQYHGQYIVVPLIKELAQKIVTAQQRTVEHKSTDSVLKRADFRELSIAALPSGEVYEVVELCLIQEGTITMGRSHSGLEVVKIKSGDERIASPVNKTDMGIVSIKESVSLLSRKCQSLEEKALSLKQKALERFKAKDRESALRYMRQLKQVQKTWQQRDTALHNIKTVLHQIEMADTDAMVIQAYRSGAEALKSLRESHGLTVENAEAAMEDLSESLQENEEIADILGGEALLDPIDIDHEGELKELDELLLQEIGQCLDKGTEMEELERELDALDIGDSSAGILPPASSPPPQDEPERKAVKDSTSQPSATGKGAGTSTSKLSKKTRASLA